MGRGGGGGMVGLGDGEGEEGGVGDSLIGPKDLGYGELIGTSSGEE